jgi:hypothetical protein
MLADLIKVALLLVGMLGACETVELMQFDVLSRNARDDFLISSFGTGTINPLLDIGRMNVFDAGDSLRAQVFEPLLDGPLNLLFRRFKVVEDRPETVAESISTLRVAEDQNRLIAPQRIATVVG